MVHLPHIPLPLAAIARTHTAVISSVQAMFSPSRESALVVHLKGQLNSVLYLRD